LLLLLLVLAAGALLDSRGARREVVLSSRFAPTPAAGGQSSNDSAARAIAECPGCDFSEPPALATSVPAILPTQAPPTIAPTEAPPTPVPTSTAVPTPTVPPAVAPFEVPARAVAILEADCGAMLYGKEAHQSLPPASLTKIVTALAVVNRVQLTDRIVSDISARELKQRTRSSVMGLEPGMTVSIEDLLYGLFLPSGNDAAILLAKHVSGSEDAFASLMNETALSLGMKDSRFDNPHGLDSDGLLSSAYDMAIAGMALMQNPTLAHISGASSYTLSGGLSFDNGNRLLAQYPGAYGVKIGYTNDARHTIVGAAERDGRRLFISVLGSRDLYNETSDLLDWAFTLPRAC
jgi:D-alanyl-D-alanine carboxypeptidase